MTSPLRQEWVDMKNFIFFLSVMDSGIFTMVVEFSLSSKLH